VERGVPEWVEQRAQETLLGLANRLAEQHEYVEVGVGTQMAAAVPAERDDCGPLRAATRGVVQPLQLAIDLLGIAVERRRSAVAGNHGAADGPPRVLDLARHGPTVTPISVDQTHKMSPRLAGRANRRPVARRRLLAGRHGVIDNCVDSR